MGGSDDKEEVETERDWAILIGRSIRQMRGKNAKELFKYFHTEI